MRTALHLVEAALLLGGLLCCAAQAAQADQALVIGINHYSNLAPFQQLDGCVNDADAMKQMLERCGFKVTKLTDENATKQAILDACKTVGSAIKPEERFVFYFAGHGSEYGRLIPHNATLQGANCIDRDELRDAVRAVPARARTVILDACFSGSLMARDLQPGMHVRFVALQNRPPEHLRAMELDEGGLGAPETPNAATDPGDICYVTGSHRNQLASEMTFDGVEHGVFTYYLTHLMPDQPASWSSVMLKVQEQMQSLLAEKQLPALSDGYAQTTVFEGKSQRPQGDHPMPMPPVPDPTQLATGPRTVWDDYNQDNVDHNRFQLTLDPDKTPLAVGDKVTVGVKIGEDGYLVILSRDTKGRIVLVYPRDRANQRWHVIAGTVKTFANSSNDRPGPLHVRALLFQSQQRAEALINQFPPSFVIDSAKQAAGRDLVLGPERDLTAFYTSDLIYDVVSAASAKN